VEVQTLTFSLERETKNTVRYSEQADGDPPTVGTIYVQKSAMGDNPPEHVDRYGLCKSGVARRSSLVTNLIA
jgi:hypothetical protein